MRNIRLLLLALLVVVAASVQAYEFIWGDTSRTGYGHAKDPVIVYHGGRYVMYYSIPPGKGHDGWNIGIAESSDLKGWKRIGELTPATDYEAKGLCAPGAIVRGDTIHLFYQTYGGGRNDAICHAYSTDGLKFTRDATNPIFRATGDWNCGRAIDAEVCQFRDRYFLYFASRDPQFERQILGVATAPLGTDFRRQDWTQASDKAILEPELPWEGKCIEGASVIEHKGRLYMFYAADYNNCPQQIGVATSTDGINWQRCYDQPLLRNGYGGEWNESESGHPCIYRDQQGETHLFFQGNDGKGRHWLLSSLPIRWTGKGPQCVFPTLKAKAVNPVMDADVPDPSVIRVGDTYYAAATSGNHKEAYPRFRSKNLVDWEPMGYVFDKWPEWTDGSFWAPELYQLADRTMCYYTARQKSDGTSCIGVAVSMDGPEGTFRDCGPLIRTTNEAIDAFVFRNEGRLFVSWKAYGLDPSGRPIELLCQELTDDGMHLVGEPFMLLRDDERQGMEGQCIFRQGDYWYILYSIRDCCTPKSDYAVSVARSRSLEGPFEKYEGNPILEGNGADIQSCGHGTMVRTLSGRMYYLCHAYYTGRFKEGRKAILQELTMGEDGWPHFRQVKGNKAAAKVKVE